MKGKREERREKGREGGKRGRSLMLYSPCVRGEKRVREGTFGDLKDKRKEREREGEENFEKEG